MQLEESLAEAGGEGRSRLGNAAFSACELCCESREEVVFCLIRSQDGDRRQNTKCISS